MADNQGKPYVLITNEGKPLMVWNIPKDMIEVTVKTDATLLGDKVSNKIIYILIIGIVIIIGIIIWRELRWSGVITRTLERK